MKQYKFSYFFGQAVRGLWRNGVMSFASIAVLMSCLIVLGSFTMLVANINVNLDELGLQNEIMVFVEPDLTDDELLRVEQMIRNISYVGEVRHITKDEALDYMIEQVGEENRDLYEAYRDDNPLSDSFEITNIDGAHYTDVTYSLSQIEGIRKTRDQRALANMMQSLKNGVTLIFSWFLVILFVVSVFVIINTVKLSVYSRKNEIVVMRYIGATGLFIALPFIIEGAMIGLVSSMIAYLLENVLYGYIQSSVSDIVSIIHIIPLSDVRLTMFFGFAAVGILTGVIGSAISISKYTRN